MGTWGQNTVKLQFHVPAFCIFHDFA